MSMKLIGMIPARDRGNIVTVARALSALVNAPDDGGV